MTPVGMREVGSALGDGMAAADRFIADFVSPLFHMDSDLEDGYRSVPLVLPHGLVVATDSFTVDPIEFPGGSLGTLAAAGVINDLVASGARPTYFSLAVVASESLDAAVLERCLVDLARETKANGVSVVCGDTKTHPSPQPALIFAVTGIGLPFGPGTLGLSGALPGDDIWVTGALGDHAVAVIAAREGIGFESVVRSDCTPLLKPLEPIVEQGLATGMRDLTRGGLVSAVTSGARASGYEWRLRYDELPLHRSTVAAAEMLGLDPLVLANEGSMLLTAPQGHRGAIAEVLAASDETREGRVVGEVASARTGAAVLELADGHLQVLTLPDRLGVPRLC